MIVNVKIGEQGMVVKLWGQWPWWIQDFPEGALTPERVLTIFPPKTV